MDNLKEFNQLIYTYKSITIEKIERVWNEFPNYSGGAVLNNLTGFGWSLTCSLCKAVRSNCIKCIWVIKSMSNCSGEGCDPDNKNSLTYYAIKESNTSSQLYQAIQLRISRMEEILNEGKK